MSGKAKGKSKAKQTGISSAVIFAVIALVAIVRFFGDYFDPAEEQTRQQPAVLADGNCAVHFINVGQADSILIISPSGESMLIDAGEKATSKELIKYIQEQGISKLDIVVATHPHSDHIGGMADIIKAFEIGEFIAPKATHTTVTFENMLDALLEKNLQVTTPVPGAVFSLGENGPGFTVLGPIGDDFENLNNASVAFRMVYGETSFVFTGDAEASSEKQMLDSGRVLPSDVLKLGHHGSSTSTSQAFLDAVAPKIAVISCGVDNSYGHPHKETLEKLKKAQITIYRTDLDSTIVLVSDGKAISKKEN